MIATREQRITRVCFALSPPADDLAALGERERWLLYRRMVRTRIRDMVRAGLPRFARAIGDGAFESLVDDWLAARAPQSRFIRDVVPECAAFFAGGWATAHGVSLYCAELARYECARWTTAHGDVGVVHAAEPFVFDRPPLLNPSASLLTVAHAVHLEGKTAPGTHHLLIYRRQDNHNVGAVELGALESALVEGWRAQPLDAAHETARTVADRAGVAVDGAFVERLGTLAALLIERNVLLGSR